MASRFVPELEAITGGKREPWLVKTVGLLTVVVGAVLAADPAPTRQCRWLGLGSALAFAAVDVWYAGIRRGISPIYLLDALLELALASAWIRTSLQQRIGTHESENRGT